eukprot:TRINITY_DN12789_c0_g1_i1.p1 TRINITY_DN12789_c0_g1~~TRINITY_DN12789_c0_g1_i1.p1  ORF type:complete len:115 (-),score=36.66 TRINITY_DN12789_c0_g1_i1:1-345(-)
MSTNSPLPLSVSYTSPNSPNTNKNQNSTTNKTLDNEIYKFAPQILRSERARLDAQLWADYEYLLNGHAVYIPHFFCPKNDFSILKSLTQELSQHTGEGNYMVNWSQHFLSLIHI